MNSDTILKLKPFLEKLNSKQKKIAIDNLSLVFFDGETPMIKNGNVSIGFLDYIKSKCNCN